MRMVAPISAAMLACGLGAATADGQTAVPGPPAREAAPAPGPSAASRVPGRCVTPAAERPGEIGCYLTASDTLGALTAPPGAPLFWHLDAYPTRAAAEAARQAARTDSAGAGGPVGGGTVVASLGRVWLFTIAPADWRPAVRGERVGRVGPLPAPAGRAYVARYMESVLPAGLPTAVHRHAGAEAWYVVAGAQCLETPAGAQRMRAGDGGVLPAGPPMLLVGEGPEVRRVLVLVLHDAAEPWMTLAADWTPTGACSRAGSSRRRTAPDFHAPRGAARLPGEGARPPA